MISRTARIRRTAAASLAIALASITAVALPAAPAYAAASVSVHVEGREDLVGVADPTYLTQLRVSGSGFQSVVNGFGGLYVFFGWVEPGESWKPSNGGTTGANYRYVPDDETNPVGYALFVTFPGSSTAYAANGGELAADGTWSSVISVPGAAFTALDRDGNSSEVDCRSVQCGIITIGAHGVKNANNETFTPISFTDLYGDATAAQAVPPADEAVVTEAVPTPAPTTTSYHTEYIEAAGDDDDSLTALVPVLLWTVAGVGVLVLAAVIFLVWAVLSARRRARVHTAGVPSADAAAGGTPPASGDHEQGGGR
ncbi:hypothetical protein GCM10027416_04790 [Okibacterium endophyticum]